MLNFKQNQMDERMRDMEEELEMKSGENNRLRTQVADLEQAIKDLYQSRKGTGSLAMQLEQLKSDNEKLLLLLRATSEY